MNVRERAAAAVEAEIDQHVPRLWRARAKLYVPLIAAKIEAFVEMIRAEETDSA